MISMTESSEMLAEAKDVPAGQWANIFDDIFPEKGRAPDTDQRQVAYTCNPDGSPTLGTQKVLRALLLYACDVLDGVCRMF